LLSIAETKIAEKDKVIADKDKLIIEKDKQLSQLISESASVNEAVPNEPQHNSHPQHDNGASSPSLLEDVSFQTPSRDSDVQWNKRKKRKRSKHTNKLKQITLTQHQTTRLSLSLRKNDRSINVIPQSPFIDLSTISSDEEQIKPVSDGDTTDGYSSSNEFVKQNLINQDQGGTINEYTTASQDQGSLNYDTVSHCLENGGNMTSQGFIPIHSQSQDNDLTTVYSNGNFTVNHTNILISQDNVVVSQDHNLTHGAASLNNYPSQSNAFVCGEANHNHSFTTFNQDLDHTFAPAVATYHVTSQNSVDSQDRNSPKQQCEDQRYIIIVFLMQNKSFNCGCFMLYKG